MAKSQQVAPKPPATARESISTGTALAARGGDALDGGGGAEADEGEDGGGGLHCGGWLVGGKGYWLFEFVGWCLGVLVEGL